MLYYILPRRPPLKPPDMSPSLLGCGDVTVIVLNSLPLYKEKIFCYDFSSFKHVDIYFIAQIIIYFGGIFPCAFEKNVYSAVVGWHVL